MKKLLDFLTTELTERGDVGSLETLQAAFLAGRGAPLCGIPVETLQCMLLLLLAQQRKGHTVAEIGRLRQELLVSAEVIHRQAVDDLCNAFVQLAHAPQGFAAQAGSPCAVHALLIWTQKNDQVLWGFQRAWNGEERIALRLEQWCAPTMSPQPAENILSTALQEALRTGFPNGGEPHAKQLEAIRMALRERFCVVSGGPGTGKTTVVKMLVAAVCHALGEKADRVVVCAPTGRAKARLEESMHKDLPPDSPLRGVQGKTLHGLLRYRQSGAPFFNALNPLPYGLVVVDEVSMVDSAMFADLADALAPTARLVLVGDMHQLPSVDSGAVLGDLTTARSAQLGERLCVLTHNFRTDKRITDWWQQHAQKPAWTPVVSPENFTQALRQWVDALRKSWANLRAQATPDLLPAHQLKAHIESGRILCCTNRGLEGREQLNRNCRDYYAGARTVGNRYMDGEPLIVEQNQKIGDIALYNGDLGVAWVNRAGRQRGVFYSGGAIRIVDLARVQEVQRAYAITVHKSQGSEFGKVLLQLPSETSRMVSRQLVYTAVTRARTELIVNDPAGLLQNELPEERRLTLLGAGGKS